LTDFCSIVSVWNFRNYKDTYHPKPTIAQKKLLYQRCEDHDLFRLPPAWSRGENPNFGHIEGPMLVKVMGKKNFTVAKVVVSLHLNVQHCEMVPWESHHDDHGWPSAGESGRGFANGENDYSFFLFWNFLTLTSRYMGNSFFFFSTFFEKGTLWVGTKNIVAKPSGDTKPPSTAIHPTWKSDSPGKLLFSRTSFFGQHFFFLTKKSYFS
jgi:hypothetical protein